MANAEPAVAPTIDEPTAMRFDLPGRIRNTPVAAQNALLPIFEAVVNAIHAIEDRFGSDSRRRGRVQLTISRVPQATLPHVGRTSVASLLSVEIRDNGLGFTPANYSSFTTSDSTAKAARGGKGVGRFTWLAVFERARVDSVFVDGTDVLRRHFSFEVTPRGIERHEVEPASGGHQGTTVTLQEPGPKYAEALRRGPQALIERLFEHCFNYLALGNCPSITLTDDAEPDEEFDLDDLFQQVECEPPEEVLLGENTLSLRYVRQPYATGRNHQVHLCANDRAVVSLRLSSLTSLGADALVSDSGEPFVQHVYVSGPLLDASVDSSRTRLDLPDAGLFSGSADFNSLKKLIGEKVESHLQHVLERVRDDNFKRVSEHIRSEQPQYRHLVRLKPDALRALRWTDNERQLDEGLYRIQQDLEADIRKRQRDVEQKLVQESAEPGKLAEELARVVLEVNEAGQADLVRYVAKRRAVLALLERLMSTTKGERTLEEHVHRIVFPTKTTADDIAYEDHNLWLVDETLSFYEHVASDISLQRNVAAPVDSPRRPDLLAFKTGDPYQHVALVEFKRPERDDENPVEQLVDYAILLRDGGAKDESGRTIPGVPRNVRIDAYAVVTVTSKMRDLIRRSPGNLAQVEGEWRWYGGMPEHNLTIEVLDYRAFVSRAKQRNYPFFTKLGLK